MTRENIGTNQRMARTNIRTEGFAGRLMDLMEGTGVTQAQVANRLGVSQGTVSAWVNGAVPQPRTARALADSFGVTPEWLLYREGNKLPAGRPEQIIKGFAVREEFRPRLSEKVSWPPERAGLDQPALKELGLKLGEAAAALAACAKIIAKSAGHKRGRKRNGPGS
jgi:transcriptional regulator with XRE-family HTH domain